MNILAGRGPVAAAPALPAPQPDPPRPRWSRPHRWPGLRATWEPEPRRARHPRRRRIPC